MRAGDTPPGARRRARPGAPETQLTGGGHAREGSLGGRAGRRRRVAGRPGPRIGAAIAFFTALSLAPILVIALVIAGLVYGEGAARGEVADQLAGLVGAEAAKAVEGVLANSGAPRAGAAAVALSL